MDHTHIEENQVAERYVQGTLPAAEAERFENHYLSCPECLDRLDLAESVQRGFRRAATQDAGKLIAVRQLAILAWLARLGRRSQAGLLLAAFLGLTILPTGLYLRANASLAGEHAAREQAVRQLARLEQPKGNVPVLQLEKERGTSAPGEGPTLHLFQPAEGQIVLAPQVDPPFQPSYRARLLNGRGREICRLQDLHPDDRDTLRLSVPASLLSPGDYSLVVEGITLGVPPEDTGRFAFRITPG